MTDGQRGAAVPPSRGSVLMMAVITLMTIYGTFWVVMAGEVFDGRNLVGALLGTLASVVMIAQTIARLNRRLEADDARKEYLIEQRIQYARGRVIEHDDEVDSDVRG